MEYPKTPTLDQMLDLERQGRSTAIQEFIDWLLDDQGWDIAKLDPGGGETVLMVDREKLMAEFFHVDLEAAERERLAVLEYVRSQDAENAP